MLFPWDLTLLLCLFCYFRGISHYCFCLFRGFRAMWRYCCCLFCYFHGIWHYFFCLFHYFRGSWHYCCCLSCYFHVIWHYFLLVIMSIMIKLNMSLSFSVVSRSLWVTTSTMLSFYFAMICLKRQKKCRSYVLSVGCLFFNKM